MKIDLDDEFDAFMRKTNPTVQQHEVQYKETRRAFFAGCALVFYFIRKILNRVMASEESYKDAALAEEACEAVGDLEEQLKEIPKRLDKDV